MRTVAEAYYNYLGCSERGLHPDTAPGLLPYSGLLGRGGIMKAYVLLEIRVGEVDNGVEIIDPNDPGSRCPGIGFIAEPFAGSKRTQTFPAVQS